VDDSIDEELLKKISYITSGSYYRASTLNDLQNIFDHIDELERSKLDSYNYVSEELFIYPLIAAILLFISLTIFTEILWTEI
jgi:Ca-activated chloride channel family protein